MKRCILVVLDGLNYDVAYENMGFLQALCEENIGKLYKMQCELPSISRPLYECILTGVKPALSGIVNNHLSFSTQKSIFNYVKNAGLKAGAAAYHWVFELYNKMPFNPYLHRHIDDESLPLSYGSFYCEDDYLDSHLFMDGENLRLRKNLDFLLIHSMNIDDSGHKFNVASKEYANATKKADYILSTLLLNWLKEGIDVIITSDHGMNTAHTHGGLSEEERLVPFFVFGNSFSLKECEVLQMQICGTICEVLNIKHDKTACKSLLKG